MKKILFLSLALLVVCANCEAKDYAKMHMKQMKKNQEYRINNTYFNDYSVKENDVNTPIKDPKLIKLSGYKDVSAQDLKTKFISNSLVISLSFSSGNGSPTEIGSSSSTPT